MTGNRIRELRQARGLTVHALAVRAGKQAPQISRYENGRIVPHLETARAIADALGVTLDELFPRQEASA